VKIKDGIVTLEMSDGLREMVDRALAESGQVTLSAMEEVLDEVFNSAKAAWPEVTGKSKKSLRKYIRRDGKQIVVGITNDAPYAYMIRVKRQPRRRVWNELVSKPGKKTSKKLARQVGRDLAKSIAGK